MPSRGRVLLATLLVTLPIVVLTGCTPLDSDLPETSAGSPRPTPTPAASVGSVPPPVLDALEVEIRQHRSDWAARVVQVRVHNTWGDDVVVGGVALTAPEFDGVAADPGWDRRVPPGRTRDASVPLGSPRCAAESAPATVHLEVTDPSGRTGAVTVTAADPQGHLTRIRGEDCARLEVERGVRLRLEQDLRTEVRDGELVATVQLRVTPVPGGPDVTVERVDGTVLLSPVDGTAWPAEPLGAPVRRAGTLRLDLVPSRCDPHAVAEDKRGTFFGVHAVVDGRAQPVFHLDAGDELRGRLRAFVGEHCGW